MRESTAGGRGKVIVSENGGTIDGLLSYRFEEPQSDIMYLCIAAVKRPRSGAVTLYRMCEAMIEAEKGRDIRGVRAKTWQGNQDGRGFLEKLGLKPTKTVPGAFGGVRTTVVYEGSWTDVVDFFDPRRPGAEKSR